MIVISIILLPSKEYEITWKNDNGVAHTTLPNINNVINWLASQKDFLLC